jgi:hypothetical protein
MKTIDLDRGVILDESGAVIRELPSGPAHLVGDAARRWCRERGYEHTTRVTRRFLCWDAETSSVDAIEITAESTRAAATAYVDSNDWFVEDSTIWIDVRVAELPRVPDELALEHDARHRVANGSA